MSDLMLEEFFESETFKEIYIRNIEMLKAKLKEDIQLNTPFFNFTDHGINHSEEINKRLVKLFHNLFSNSDVRIRLNNSELYALIAAIYLHDIGMDLIKKEEIIKMFQRKEYKNEFHSYLANLIDSREVEKFQENSPEFYNFIRSKHHIISAMWIMNYSKYSGTTLNIPILESFIQEVALIVFSHNEDISVFDNEFYRNTQVNNHILQIKLLSYLLRVGDALHIDRSRCLIDILEFKDIPVESKIHWFKHYYTKSISIENQCIEILFEFPDEEKWNADIESYFISETVYWINQNFDDVILKKIFEDSHRNALLKCVLSHDKKYLSAVKSLDVNTNKKIIERIGNKTQLALKEIKEKYVAIYEEKFNEQLIHNKYDGCEQRSLEDIFVEPRLYECSEYRKDDKNSEEKQRKKISDILSTSQNLLIAGKQGIGKTTLLRYLFVISKNYSYIPFIFDFLDIMHDTDDMIYKKLKKITNNENLKINLDYELQNASCIILIDNVDKDSKFFRHISEFSKNYSNNRIIMTRYESETEEIKSLDNIVKEKDNADNIKELFIHYLGISELRIIVNRWFRDSERDSYTVFSSIFEYILQNNLPRTPLLYSLFLSIIEKESAFLPVNVASLFDKFADIYLGRYTNLFQNYRSKNDYYRKKYVLKELAKFMIDNNKKELLKTEYYSFIDNLFGSKGVGIKVDKDELLSDLRLSNLFVEENGYVKFSFDCFLFFFYAKSIAEKDKSSDVLFDNLRFQKFSSIIVFYSGLLMNCKELLEDCSLHLIEMGKIDNDLINKRVNDIFYDNKMSMFDKIDIKPMDEKDIQESIDNQCEQELLIEDISDNLPEKQLTDEEHNFISMLFQVCNMLKYSEYIDSNFKKEVLELCIDCYVFIICEAICNLKNLKKDTPNPEEITEDFIYNIITFLTFITESIIHSTLGTSMLEGQIKELIKNPKNVLCDFIYCMLCAELALEGYLEIITDLINRTNNYLLLDCLIIKLEIIFEERNFYNKPSEKKKMLSVIRLAVEKILKERDREARYKVLANQYIDNIRKRKLAYEHQHMPFLALE